MASILVRICAKGTPLVLLRGRMYWRDLQPSAENSQVLYHSQLLHVVCYSGFNAEYNINSTCIKEIKAMYINKKNLKKPLLKGMNEFLEAKSEAYQIKAAAIPEPDEEIAGGLVRCM